MIDHNLAEPQDLQLGDWTIKVRPSVETAEERVILLNHGWTGDERSMWVFANQLPKSAWLIAPRAPYVSTHPQYGGYSWVEERNDHFSSFEDFAPARTAFFELLSKLSVELEIGLDQFALVGFSQGAAFNVSLALDHPERVVALASLAGFVPEGSRERAETEPLMGKRVFIAHGSEDETVPVAMAGEAQRIMQLAGADVEYCQSNVGHKLGANCFRALKTFFSAN